MKSCAFELELAINHCTCMDLGGCKVRTCGPWITVSKGHEVSLPSRLQAGRRLASERDAAFSRKLVSCRSCCGGEPNSADFAPVVSGFRSPSSQTKQNRDICRMKPLAKPLSKGKTIEDEGCNETIDTDLACKLSGFIYPSAKTVGKSTNIVWQQCMVKREERENILGQKGCAIWITGLSGSGKSTLACTLDHQLSKLGKLSYVLDGDNLRHGLNKNLGFSSEDRAENIRRIGEVAKIFVDAGVICIASAISPYRKDRDACRELLRPGEFIEVHMDFPLKLCEERDPKGLYKLARTGKIKGFTGVDDPYEAPLNCEIIMKPNDGKCPSPADMATLLVSYLEKGGFLGDNYKM